MRKMKKQIATASIGIWGVQLQLDVATLISHTKIEDEVCGLFRNPTRSDDFRKAIANLIRKKRRNKRVWTTFNVSSNEQAP